MVESGVACNNRQWVASFLRGQPDGSGTLFLQSSYKYNQSLFVLIKGTSTAGSWRVNFPTLNGWGRKMKMIRPQFLPAENF